MLRICLVAPDATGLDLIPEIRELTASHNVTVLSGPVSSKDVYQTCKLHTYDILHFAGHGDHNGVQLTAGELLRPADIAQLCRMSEAKLIFLNACEMQLVAGYLVRHGAKYAVAAIIKILDTDAWRAPLIFYNRITHDDELDLNLVRAYMVAEGDGILYNLLIAPTFLESIFQNLKELSRKLTAMEHMLAKNEPTTITITRKTMWLWLATWLAISTATIYLITLLLNR